jgi:hypothetical protein
MKKLDYFEFRSFFMNEIASYLDSYKSDLFLDIATLGNIRSNKTVYFFMRKLGTHLVSDEKDVKFYFDLNERGFRFDFIVDNLNRIESVTVSELNKEDYNN